MTDVSKNVFCDVQKCRWPETSNKICQDVWGLPSFGKFLITLTAALNFSSVVMTWTTWRTVLTLSATEDGTLSCESDWTRLCLSIQKQYATRTHTRLSSNQRPAMTEELFAHDWQSLIHKFQARTLALWAPSAVLIVLLSNPHCFRNNNIQICKQWSLSIKRKKGNKINCPFLCLHCHFGFQKHFYSNVKFIVKGKNIKKRK